MKANRKFLNGDDEAVSPVIAVILMVAITVVLAATVYVWVSGFGSQTNAQQKSLSVVSASSLSSTGGYWKNYTIASASTDLKYGDLLLTVDGTSYTFATGASACGGGLSAQEFAGCLGANERAADDYVKAGDTLQIRFSSSNPTDDKLVITDQSSNNVMVTQVVR